MGRRKSLFGQIVTEIAKAGQRQASDERRKVRRAQTESARSQERHRVSEQRSRERDSASRHRADERARIRNERDDARRRKEEERLAQLDSWADEVQAHNDRDDVILSVANGAPEVEERESLFRALERPIPFEAAPFVPPTPTGTSAALIAFRDNETARTALATGSFAPVKRSWIPRGLGFFFMGVFVAGVLETTKSAPHPYLIMAGVAGATFVWTVFEKRRRQEQVYNFISTQHGCRRQREPESF